MCKTPLAVGTSGVAAQRITSVAWKRRGEGIGELNGPGAMGGLVADAVIKRVN
jgi:hypothetical protein